LKYLKPVERKNNSNVLMALSNATNATIVFLEQSQINVNTVDNVEKHVEDGGYGWLIVIASFFVHSCVIGVPSTFGIYQNDYILEPIFEGGEIDLAVALIGGFATSSLDLFAIPPGRLSDRIGHKIMCCIGGIVMCISLVVSSFGTQYWHFLV
jgi:MFS family permease